jgi:hypothetical protein
VDLPRRLEEQLAEGELPDPNEESEESEDSDPEPPAGSAGAPPKPGGSADFVPDYGPSSPITPPEKGNDRDATMAGGTSLLDVLLTPRSLVAKQQRESGSAEEKPSATTEQASGSAAASSAVEQRGTGGPAEAPALEAWQIPVGADDDDDYVYEQVVTVRRVRKRPAGAAQKQEDELVLTSTAPLAPKALAFLRNTQGTPPQNWLEQALLGSTVAKPPSSSASAAPSAATASEVVKFGAKDRRIAEGMESHRRVDGSTAPKASGESSGGPIGSKEPPSPKARPPTEEGPPKAPQQKAMPRSP